MDPAANPPSRRALLGLDRAALAEELADWADRPFRIDQVYRALHERRVRSFEEMTDLRLDLRAALSDRWKIGHLPVRERQASSDGTCKYLFELSDGATIEAVDIPDGARRTLCVSSQAGCALACSFCVTGYWGAGRDLTTSEIVAQVHAIRDDHERDLEREGGVNLVFMGMGEPLLNLDSVHAALLLLTESISWRRITVSTAGVVPGIDQMAAWDKRPNLAISLHAPDNDRRSEIMPINRKYPLEELFAAIERFPLEPRRRITFEYTLIKGFNDDPRDADLLERLLHRIPAKVNLIPLNPDPVLGPIEPPSWPTIEAFKRALQARGISCTVRRPRGDDVSAACGQLRAFGRSPRGPLARASRSNVPRSNVPRSNVPGVEVPVVPSEGVTNKT